jgi:hypothetical protein
MRRIRLAAVATGLALAFAACASATPESDAPATLAASGAPSPEVIRSLSAPAPSALPAPSVTASPGQGAADVVLDAALASQAEGTVRYTVDVRSADPEDPNPPQTATGQVSFGDPGQFRFASPGLPGTVPPSEVIFDGDTLYSRGRDTPYLPEDTWVTFHIKEGTIGSDMVMRQYGDSLLVLVTPLGVTSAVRKGDEPIGTRDATRYVTQVDVTAARQHLPESLLPAYDARMANLSSAGVPPTHEVEVWVDSDGRIARTRYVQELQGQDVDALVVTYDFDGYGDPMEAAPPSGAELLTLEEAQERRQAAETPKPS